MQVNRSEIRSLAYLAQTEGVKNLNQAERKEYKAMLESGILKGKATTSVNIDTLKQKISATPKKSSRFARIGKAMGNIFGERISSSELKTLGKQLMEQTTMLGAQARARKKLEG